MPTVLNLLKLSKNVKNCLLDDYTYILPSEYHLKFNLLITKMYNTIFTRIPALSAIRTVRPKTWKQPYGSDTLTFTYVGVGGPTEDEEYFTNPILQREMPRGYTEIYLNGKLVRIIHGCNKFFGEEDESVAGITADVKLPKVCIGDFTHKNLASPDTMVDITAKCNGKFMTLSFFDTDGQTWVIMTSKTTGVVFHLGGDAPSFQKAGAEENQILKGMYDTFLTFWSALPESARDALLQNSVNENFTYLCEYEDGAHMVPLVPEKPCASEDGAHMVHTLTITMIIQCNQTGQPSNSAMLHLVDGMHFAEWLLKIGIPKRYIVDNLLVTIQEWFDKYSKEYSNTNFFEQGRIIEGYVVRFVSPDGRMMALMKSKTHEYIIKRAIREIFRGLIRTSKKDGKPITPADASARLRKKLTGPNAYPQGLSHAAISACCKLACEFVGFCLKMNLEQGIPLDNFVNFGGASDVVAGAGTGHPDGMADSWELFLANNGGHGLPECLSLIGGDDDLIDSVPDMPISSKPEFVLDMGVVGQIAGFISTGANDVAKFTLGDVTVTATGYSKPSVAAPLVIFQAISGTGKTTLCRALSSLIGNSVICCADDYFQEKCSGKFIPARLGDAHHESHMKAFTAPLDSTIFVCNTNCNLKDAIKYTKYAVDCGRQIIFLNLVPHGTFEEFSARLATRGEHVNDPDTAIGVLQKQWQTMMQKSNSIPRTLAEFGERFKLSSMVCGTALDLTVPKAVLDKVPQSKKSGHITLCYGTLVHGLLTNPELAKHKVELTEIREFVDPVNPADAIACVAVRSSVLDALHTAGLIQPFSHVTLYTSGRFKPVQSRELLDGTLQPTRTVPVGSAITAHISYF